MFFFFLVETHQSSLHMGSIALNVFTDIGNFEGCGTQPLVLHVAEFKRKALYQPNLKLVTLPSNSASKHEKGGVGTRRSPRQTPIENRTQTFQSHSSYDPNIVEIIAVND